MSDIKQGGGTFRDGVEAATKAIKQVGTDWHNNGDELKGYAADYLEGYVSTLTPPDDGAEALLREARACVPNFSPLAKRIDAYLSGKDRT